jgi:WD40 repeat-containing protein SMU1
MTSSSDGTCRVWETKSCETLLSFRPDAIAAQSLINEIALLSIFVVPNTPDYVIVCAKNKQAFMLTPQGRLIQKYSAAEITNDFLSFALSCHGKYLYCATMDGKVIVFNVADGSIEETLAIEDREIIGMFHHPQRNMLVTMTDHGLLKLWKA